MPGPIRSFIDTLQERQPVRNAVRDFLGVPRRYGSVIDPMDEMSARDYSNVGSRRLASNAPMAVEPEGGLAMPIPEETPQVIQTGAPDPLKPFKGMSIAQAAVTAPNEVLDKRRYDGMPPQGQAPRQSPQQSPQSLAAVIDSINASKLPAADKYGLLADEMAKASFAPGVTPERVNALAGWGRYYLQARDRQLMLDREESRRGQALTDREAEWTRRGKEIEAQTAASEKLLEKDYELQQRAAAEQAKLRGRPANFEDAVAVLDTGEVPLSTYMETNRSAAIQGMPEKPNEKPEDVGRRAANTALLTGTGRILANLTKRNAELGYFGPASPAFPDIQAVWQAKLAEKPTIENYDSLAAQLAGIMAVTVGAELTKNGAPPSERDAYIEETVASVLGPRPAAPNNPLIPDFIFPSYWSGE